MIVREKVSVGHRDLRELRDENVVVAKDRK